MYIEAWDGWVWLLVGLVGIRRDKEEEKEQLARLQMWTRVGLKASLSVVHLSHITTMSKEGTRVTCSGNQASAARKVQAQVWVKMGGWVGALQAVRQLSHQGYAKGGMSCEQHI